MKKRDFLKVGVGVAATLVLASCKKPTNNTVTNFTLTAQEINDVMWEVGALPSNFFTRDASYSLPSISYINGEFSNSLRSFLFNLSSAEWKTESNDCDDFAMAACFLMNFLHHNTVNKVKNTGIAFGEFYYYKQGVGYHAINVAVVRDENQKIKVVFFEPQTYSIVELNKEEIESCVFWRF